MTDRSARAGRLITWGVATAPVPGESQSGDRYVVAPVPDGVLIAGVDGLGHGSEAAEAAQRAAETLKQAAHEGVIPLAKRCHEVLLGTRGVVLTVAKISSRDGTLTWLGVGNVQGVLFRAHPSANPPREQVLLRGGVVGYNLPSLSASVVTIAPGDLVVLATDGVRPDFPQAVFPTDDPQALANRLLRQFAQPTDDALVLVARYDGGR